MVATGLPSRVRTVDRSARTIVQPGEEVVTLLGTVLSVDERKATPGGCSAPPGAFRFQIGFVLASGGRANAPRQVNERRMARPVT
jgi:hypothetical protein